MIDNTLEKKHKKTRKRRAKSRNGTGHLFGAAVVSCLLLAASVALADDLWSSPSTWPNNTLPAPGQEVEIPAGKTIILDTKTPVLGGVNVRGTLKFAEQSTVELSAEWILVAGPGSALEIGTESTPYKGQATITLHGTDEEKSIMGMGNKFIAAMNGGVVDIHGSSRSKLSWTQLDQDAMPGDTSLTLAENTGWQTGDQIALAPSNWNAEETEVVKVVSATGTIVEITPAIKFPHRALITTYEDKLLDQRAEVGLLNRNILIQGAEDSLISNFGGHTMAMNGGIFRIEGAEFFRMGQMGHKARYPIHWHLLDRVSGIQGSGTGQYARFNSIHHSFQRAVVVHGTGGVLVQNNVSYDISNHAFVPSEDGDEINNVFIENVAFLQKSPAKEDFAFPKPVSTGIASTQGESRSAAFWFRNPNNTMIGNHAAGGVRSNGFFFDLRHLDKEMINLIDTTADGQAPFSQNSAHSYMWPEKQYGAPNGYPEQTKGHGLLINQTGSTSKIFADFTAYKNLSGVWIDGFSGKIKNSIVSDNGSGLVLHRGSAEDVVVVGESKLHTPGEKKPSVGRWGPSGAFHVFDEHLPPSPAYSLKNVTFVNVNDRPAIYNTTRYVGINTSVEGLKFINSPYRVLLKDFGNTRFWSYDTTALLDRDGSLVGSPETPYYVTTRFTGLLNPSENFLEREQAMYIPADQVLRLQINNSSDVAYVTRMNGEANSFVKGRYLDSGLSGKELYGNVLHLRTGYTYKLVWEDEVTPQDNMVLSFSGISASFTEVHIPWPAPDAVTLDNQPLAAHPTIETLRGSDSVGYFYDSASKSLVVRLRATGLETHTKLAVSNNGDWANIPRAEHGRRARSIEGLSQGLDFKYFDGSFHSVSIQDLRYQTPTKTGVVQEFDTSPRESDGEYSFIYSGLLKIDTPGRYYFSVSGQGDVDLYIAGTFVTGVRNGRIYLGHRKMKNGAYALGAGYHPFELVYRHNNGKGSEKHTAGLYMGNDPGSNGDLLSLLTEFYRGSEVNSPEVDSTEKPVLLPNPGPTPVPVETPSTSTPPTQSIEYSPFDLKAAALFNGNRQVSTTAYDWEGEIGKLNLRRKTLGIVGGRYGFQVDYNPATDTSEVLELSFARDTRNLTVQLTMMNPAEYEALQETGLWQAYDEAGLEIARGNLDPKEAKRIRKYTYSFALPVDSHKIRKLRISATAYGNGAAPERLENNSDFALIGISGQMRDGAMKEAICSSKTKGVTSRLQKKVKRLRKKLQRTNKRRKKKQFQKKIKKLEKRFTDLCS